MKLNNIWNHMPLKRKILTVFLPLTMIPFLLVLVISLSLLIQTGKATAVKNAEDKLLLVTNQINQILSNIRYNIKAFSTSSALQNALSATYENTTYGDYMFTTSVHSSIYNIMDIPNLISSGYIHTSDGKVYDLKADTILSPSEDMNKFYQAVVERKGRILFNHVQNDDKNGALNISKSLIDINSGKCLGILSFNIRESFFYDAYDAVVDKDIEHFYLIDNNGQILSSDERSLLQQRIDPDLFNAIKESSNQGQRLSVLHTGQLVLTTSSDIANYHIVYVMNYNNIYKSALSVAFGLMLIGMIVLMISVGLVTIFSRTLARPITQLADYADRIGQGDFSAIPQIHSNDEIGLLASRFQNMNHNIKDMTIRIYNEQTMKKEYALNLLQAQINPHFLYNCLDNINSLITDRQNDRAISMVYHLGRYYRSILSKGRNIITIHEEIQLIKDYLEIQLIKFPGLFDYKIAIAPELYNLKMIKMLLQPVVENSVIHGFSGYKDGGKIEITGILEDSTVYFTIRDNGRGISQEMITKVMTETSVTFPRHFGLRNIQQRIHLKYGDSYGLTIESIPGKGSIVSIKFPKIL